MFKQFIAILTTIVFCAGSALAHDPEYSFFKYPQDLDRSVFGTMVHGTALGAYGGLAAGWVRYADDASDMQKVWQSAGYGALGGLALGTGAAIIGPNGAGNRALYDLEMGSNIGGGVGFFCGVVSALFTGESERIASSLAWGNLAGLVAGAGFVVVRAARGKYTEQDIGNSVRPAFRFDGTAVMLTLQHTF